MDKGTARGHLPITPSDTTTLYADALFVSGAGTVTCLDRDGTSATYTCIANITLPIEVTKVMATGTTATGIVGLLF